MLRLPRDDLGNVVVSIAYLQLASESCEVTPSSLGHLDRSREGNVCAARCLVSSHWLGNVFYFYTKVKESD